MSKQKQIDQFIIQCREKKLSVTPQRLTIYRALVSDSTHPNPEQIYKKIKTDNPTISLATVYKTLETFERNGLVSMVTNLHNKVRYDPITNQHHHIICINCNTVVDLFDSGLDTIKIPKTVSNDSTLIDYSVHFKVVCSDCKNKYN